MLKIHKLHSKKLIIIGLTSILSICTLLGISYLTYTPELSHAETVVYPEKETRTMDDITYMQDITPEICQNSILNQQYILKDKRDEKSYTVARIKNQTNTESNCWMTQNLAIINKTINSTDSDIKEGSFTVPASNISGFVPSDVLQRKAFLNSINGGYYNWYTATAGSGNSLITGHGINASDSICPRRWKLPTSINYADGDFYMLTKDLTLAQGITTPYNFRQSGRIYNGAIGNSQINYWSSTANDSDTANILFYSNTLTSTAFNRYLGVTVRCLARTESIPNNNVDITINNTISLDVTNEVEVKKSNTNPSTAAFSALVASNQPYSVSISSANPALTSSTSSTTIPSKSGLLNTNDNAWGIKLSTASTYEQITTTPKLFYSSSNPESKTLPFTIGISTAPDIPNGEYSTNITITATQN